MAAAAKNTQGARAVAEMAAQFWRDFSAGRRSREFFDHEAAALYLEAADPEVLPDQAAFLRRLLDRRARAFRPLSDSRTEPHPRYGEMAMSALSMEDYLDYMLANDNYPRVTNPVATQPRRRALVHLCWAIGFHAITRAGESDSRRAKPNASSLQGLVSLLLDDWRSALRTIDVSFQAHRLFPASRSLEPAASQLYAGGRRWRNREERWLPPVELTQMLFQRPTHVDAACCEGWDKSAQPAAAREWWCVCMLECDLEEWGFRRPRSWSRFSMSSGPDWYTESSPLPAWISHVAVPGDFGGDGRFYRVKHASSDPKRATLEIAERRPAEASPVAPDPFFLRFRTEALNLVLNELWKRML